MTTAEIATLYLTDPAEANRLANEILPERIRIVTNFHDLVFESDIKVEITESFTEAKHYGGAPNVMVSVTGTGTDSKRSRSRVTASIEGEINFPRIRLSSILSGYSDQG